MAMATTDSPRGAVATIKAAAKPTDLAAIDGSREVAPMATRMAIPMVNTTAKTMAKAMEVKCDK